MNSFSGPVWSEFSQTLSSCRAPLLRNKVRFECKFKQIWFCNLTRTQLNVWKEEYKIFRSSALCLWCHASPRIVLPSCERGIREARGCKRVRANSKLWHSTCKPPPRPLCCLTLYDLWPVSTWTFKIWNFPQKAVGATRHFRRELPRRSRRDTRAEKVSVAEQTVSSAIWWSLLSVS